jgi:hypothetical protein
MSTPYTFDDYNQYGALRTPPELRFSLLVLLHQTFLATAVILSHGRGGKMGGGGGGIDLDAIAYWPVLLELPVILVLLAAAQRTPKAAAWVRKVWPHGLRLLQLSAIAELAASGWLAWTQGPNSDNFVLNLVLLGSLALTFIYLLRSAYLKDYFADFPPAPVANDVPPT